jgi:hypothetical protein
VAALGAFTYFGMSARSEDRALDVCYPACAPDRVDSVRQRYLIANISLGAGITALGLAVYLFVTSDAEAREPTAAPPTAAKRPFVADLRVTPEGGHLTAVLSF